MTWPACVAVSRRITDGSHQGGTCLTDDLLLEAEGGADGSNGVGVKISAVLSRGGVHGDELLQLWISRRLISLAHRLSNSLCPYPCPYRWFHGATQDNLEQLCNWPGNDPLMVVRADGQQAGTRHRPEQYLDKRSHLHTSPNMISANQTTGTVTRCRTNIRI